MSVITRFAPSPTGYLHIGGARTALFNYLFAKHHKGKFLLRIEDTDRIRSTNEAVEAIISGLKWLGLEWDQKEIYQFSRANRHKEVAQELVRIGKAYYCYMSQEELLDIRASNQKQKFVSKYRDLDSDGEIKEGISPVIRLKMPTEGFTVINDLIQGEVKFNNIQLDDMILIRSQGTPTYMLAAVVDDYDSGVTHIIRGDDHLNNAARQIHIYNSMNWLVPKFAHIPLIHGPDGTKLSKRHGALGIESYKNMGYLPEAICNYLLRLGWSHGNDEIISRDNAIKWFSLESIGKSPARLDFKKLDFVNQHYIKELDDEKLLSQILLFIEKNVNKEDQARLIKAMRSLKPRSTNLKQLSENCLIFLSDFKIKFDDDFRKLLQTYEHVNINQILKILENQEVFYQEALQNLIKDYCAKNSLKFQEITQTLRICLTGKTSSSSVFEIMEIIGKDETVIRIKTIIELQ